MKHKSMHPIHIKVNIKIYHNKLYKVKITDPMGERDKTLLKTHLHIIGSPMKVETKKQKI